MDTYAALVLPGTIYSVTLNPALDESIAVDTFRTGATNRCALQALDPGGKGINVSRVIHRLGRSTLAFGLAGGLSGGYLSSALDREGVPHDFETLDGFTRVNVMIYENGSRESTRLLLPGPNATRVHIMAIARRLQIVAPGEIVVFGGSLPPGLATETYAEFIVRLYDRGIRCIIDTSGAPLAAALEANPLLVRLNVEDAEELLGRRLRTDDAIVDGVCELRERGARYAVISRGSRGAIASGSEGVFTVVPPARTATSATGAGDSMTAAMAIAFNEGMSFEDALRWGAAAGTATAMASGTSLCNSLDVYRLIPDVRVERLSIVRR